MIVLKMQRSVRPLFSPSDESLRLTPPSLGRDVGSGASFGCPRKSPVFVYNRTNNKSMCHILKTVASGSVDESNNCAELLAGKFATT